MEPVSIGLIGLGGFLIWSAVSGRSPMETLKAVLNRGPAPAGTPLPSNKPRPRTLGPAFSTGKEILDNTPTANGAPRTLGPGYSTGAEVRQAGGPVRPTAAGGGGTVAGKDFGTSAGKGDQGDPLVYLGVGNKRLRPEAAAAWKAAGSPSITDNYRTYAQQVQAKLDKPTLAATPGKSQHERGNAIDVAMPISVATTQALLGAGWRQFNARKEPWHFSYGVTG